MSGILAGDVSMVHEGNGLQIDRYCKESERKCKNKDMKTNVVDTSFGNPVTSTQSNGSTTNKESERGRKRSLQVCRCEGVTNEILIL
jgi:hypothetical protein